MSVITMFQQSPTKHLCPLIMALGFMQHLSACCSCTLKCCLQWESRVNFRTGTVGFDNQIASKMAHALAHSSDSHARALGLNLCQSFRGHPPPSVFNQYVDLAVLALNSNHRGFASRVTMNVRQTFLHQPEYKEFHLGRKSSEVIGHL